MQLAHLLLLLLAQSTSGLPDIIKIGKLPFSCQGDVCPVFSRVGQIYYAHAQEREKERENLTKVRKKETFLAFLSSTSFCPVLLFFLYVLSFLPPSSLLLLRRSTNHCCSIDYANHPPKRNFVPSGEEKKVKEEKEEETTVAAQSGRRGWSAHT